MRVRFKKDAEEVLNNFDRYITKIDNKEIKYEIEIGMGKGKFITENAIKNPDKMYIGIELSKSVLSLAVKKLLRYEEENNVKVENLRFMCIDAIDLEKYFTKVDNIYLNFSDPWHKARHDKRRLTHTNFLKIYEKILNENGKINFKTDNRKLFEFSIKEINCYKMKIEEISLDLHKDNDEKNITTEYEEKFKEKGPIYKLVASYINKSVSS